MYTILENARIVISLLKKHNIRHIVISPGGSNIPIVQGVQQDPFFKCYSVVDERSAMYFAIGLYHETGEIIATSCTSAQATRNYLPGLTEAFYKHVPILAITMSKHPRYLSQEYMQCPIQTSLPVDAVKKSFSLPRISDENDRTLCVRMTNEAILELTHHKLGPVQLNIEELDSETWIVDDKCSLPEVRMINRYTMYDQISPMRNLLKDKKIMFLIGEHRVFSDKETHVIEDFCRHYDVFVYSHHISNYHGAFSFNANAAVTYLSQDYFERECIPDILITIGGLTGDYGIYSKLFNAPDESFEHWRIDRDGDIVDTYGKLTKVFEMSIEQFCSEITSEIKDENHSNHSYYEKWNKLQARINLNLDLPLSNVFAAQQLHSIIPPYSRMNFAILNSFRSWSLFDLDPSIVCAANVAAFGIDGCLSLLLGQSINTDNLSFLVTGDLAFFYDMNALGIRHIKNNVRILLINNNGGMEFKYGSLYKKTDVDSYIAASGHYKSAKGWAETCGFKYLKAESVSEFNDNKMIFISQSEAPVFFEIFTTPENERNASNILYKENMLCPSFEKIKRDLKENIKDVVGESNIKLLKKIFRK